MDRAVRGRLQKRGFFLLCEPLRLSAVSFPTAECAEERRGLRKRCRFRLEGEFQAGLNGLWRRGFEIAFEGAGEAVAGEVFEDGFDLDAMLAAGPRGGGYELPDLLGFASAAFAGD